MTIESSTLSSESLSGVSLYVGLAALTVCVALIALPDLSITKPTGSLFITTGVVPALS